MFLTLYGGVGEVGGNKILLEDGLSRLLFDFGTPFARRYRYFEEYLKPRPGAGLLDLLEMGLLPPLEGLYRADLEGEADGLWPRYRASAGYRDLRDATVDGVLLSHAHIDHSGYISFLRGDIPVYTTSLTAFTARAMQDSSGTDFEKEVCYFSPRRLKQGYLSVEGDYRQRPFGFVDAPGLSAQAQALWNSSPAKRKNLEMCSGPDGCHQVGRLPLRYFPVSHSVMGAAAFAVETSAGWVGYTGDLRCCGRDAASTQRFVTQMAALRPRLLLCEGTRAVADTEVDDGHAPATEEEVYHNALSAMRAEPGLVIADFGPRNVERLMTFQRIAQDTSRALVVLARDAYLLEAMGLVSAEVPRLEQASHIHIFQDLRSRLGNWELELHQKYASRLVTASQVRASPGDFILCFSFWDMADLVDIRPQGGTYIYSSSEAYNEEQQLDMRRLHNWIEHFAMTAVGLPREELDWKVPVAERGLHASGHASGPELLDMVRRIAPRTLVPIHTENPQYFVRGLEGSGIEVCLPQPGISMAFSVKH
ncbi:MAG: exonuclease [Chloroflexi bacterium]|nr:exonuclease [Chloroflexota bacterium]